ncbi:alpha/beta fold hydrolase [Parvibaculum sp.]|uniref:alpha/beta fold hydrolase n=1 Tax=Parvibaculum sp. TaxID=2024848 RepID=UPI0025FE4639|nr:alpha/beta fold hydrolase [Parvibaculum sp.]
MQEEFPDAHGRPGGVAEEESEQTGEDRRAALLGEAVDAVYGYASGRYNWEDLIGFLSHLDRDAMEGEPVLAPTLEGHLRRAGDLATRLHEDIAATGPDYALLLLDRQRRVVAANEEGRAYFAPVCRPVASGKRLSFLEEEHAAVFDRALADLPDGDASGPTLLRFQTEEGETQLLCYLVRGDALSPAMLRGVEFDEADPRPHCALIAASPGAGDEALEIFRTAFGLTPAEARLAARLRFGLSLKEAAEELGISVNTARNQLKSVFDKLGVNRQADLVRHLAELAALAASMQGAASRARATVTSAERQTVMLPDGRVIALRDLGRPDSFPVFILHPVVQSSLMRPQEAEIAGECGVRLISLERPGIGLSTHDPKTGHVPFARDLGRVADALGLDRFAVLGWASGAPYALAAGAVLGQRVTRVALATPRLAFRSDLEATTPMRQFFGGLRRHPWLFETVFTIMRAKRSRRFFRPMIRNFLENSEPDRLLFDRDASLLDCFTDSLIEAIDKTHKGIVAELNLYARDILVDTAGIVRPLLVWHGMKDEMNGAEDVRRMLDGVPVEAFRFMPDDGHMVLFAHFREVLSALVNDAH